MEEHAGKIWHSFITRMARTDYPDAAVMLEQVRRSVGMIFRALGGDGGLRVEAALATDYHARRNFLQRLAGSHEQAEFAWRDAETLRMPERLAVFPKSVDNRDLYLWLAALAAQTPPDAPWFEANQIAVQRILARFPGLATRYARLVSASLNIRPDPAHLPPDEAAQERSIRAALTTPGSVAVLPPAKKRAAPVWLWLHPEPPLPQGAGKRREDSDATQNGGGGAQQQKKQKKKKGERGDDPDGKSGLLAFRLESLFTRAEYVKVDRTTDDEEELSKAEDALDDMNSVCVTQADKKAAVTLRFDLDLPSPEQDDAILSGTVLVPEWDWKRHFLRPNYCCIQPMIADKAPPVELPAHLRRTAHKLRRQFEALAPVRSWHRNQAEGSDIDLDAWLRHTTDNHSGHGQAEVGLYRDFRGGNRDLACLLLADLSLSTDAWVNNSARVIDIIRDSLFLFAEALRNTGDSFALYGFSSRRRDHVRFNHIKDFQQRYDSDVRGRIQALRPGYYTRMGAAIRHASQILSKQPNTQRLLLLLTDGKPNDLDHYEGRYGVEDTRHAVLQARKQGLQVFCVTIDEQAETYLPHLFGAQHYVLIRHAAELPKQLPLLYMRLTHIH
jgi:nitric oxide reductase NorD protein